ncbi:MAG TPA: YafY family protein [Actinomycetes bacterium]|nr:YafY family protein [Actinomycetes bacterium]
MSNQRTERLLNLVICLLAARRFVTKDKIRVVVPQYAESGSDDAFERMFERDKDDLREMGIPLETGSNDVLFDDEIGYRIPRDAYALPEVVFDSEELAVLGLAARAWQQATLADAATRAVLKLEAAGVDVDPSALAVVEPRVGADEPAFGGLYEAARDRRPVTFQYQSSSSTPSAQRHLEPWGVVSWHGRWYVLGHDADRDATRLFRLSRIVGPVEFAGAPGTVDVPPDLDLRSQVQMLAPTPTSSLARIRVRHDSALPLRRRGSVISDDDEWTDVELGFGDPEQLAAELCGYGPDVVALTPPELRDAVVRRLKLVLANTSGAA